MTLVADRFIRFDDGTVRDLVTGEEVTLIELTLTGAAEQVARRDYCLARLEAQAQVRGGSIAADLDPPAPPLGNFALVDFGLVGESRWIEAYRKPYDAATSRDRDEVSAPTVLEARASSRDEAWFSRDAALPPEDAGVVTIAPVVDAITAALDGLGSHDMRRLYVKAPDGARLDSFEAIVAREVRARGFIPLSALVLGASPAIARVVASRSIVLFADARCAFNVVGLSSGSIDRGDSFSGFGVRDAVARAFALLHRTTSMVAAIVAHVCDHVNVGALRLMPANSTSRAVFGSRRAAVLGAASESRANFRSDFSADYTDDFSSASGPPPESVVQPATEVSYDDPDLPSLFPRTERIAQVAESAFLAVFESDCVAGELGDVGMPPWTAPMEIGPERSNGAGAHAPVFEEAAGLDALTYIEAPPGNDVSPRIEASTGCEEAPNFEDATQYPPLRLLKRRTSSDAAEPGMERAAPSEWTAIDIPVVTTMVSGYGDAVDLLVGRGRWAAALRALRAELGAFERRKRQHDAARTSIALGRLHLAMGEVGPATRCFHRAGELASLCGADSACGAGPRSGPGADPGSRSDSVRCDGGARLIGEALRWSGIAALDDADLERSERLLRSALAAIGPEADPHQVIAIELSLARCLFWQGRGHEVVLPSLQALAPAENALRNLAADGIASTRGAPHRSMSDRETAGRAVFADPAGVERHTLATAILRAERWRRAARIALGGGDLSSAGDAIARACRIVRGADEDDVRGGGCRVEPPERGAKSRGQDATTNDTRIRNALRAACHLDAARLQFALVDTASGDAHLRECLALTRAPARTARAQLLQLARLRNLRSSEGRRRFERLSSALRQPQTPRLVRIQARYLIDPRSRRALELVTFLDRHGDTALAGYHPTRRGGSPMLEAFQDVLRLCHETPDDLTALTSVSAWLRDQLRALSVAIYGAAPTANTAAPRTSRTLTHATTRQHMTTANLRTRAAAIERPPASVEPGDGPTEPSASVGATTSPVDAGREATGLGASQRGRETFDAYQNENNVPANPASGTVVVRYAVAGSTRILSPELAARVIDSSLAMAPTYRPDALDAAAPVRYGGATIGAIVVRWSIDAALDHTNASALIGAAAAAISPHLRAALDREPHDPGLAGVDGGVSAGTGTATATGSTAATAIATASTQRTGVSSRSRARTLGLLGVSAAIDTLRHTITRVSSAPFHVLIEGESGSGKELVARALHQHGPRRHRRFCAVNCAAFTDDLLEAELFGHTRGAFTGALTERVGLFEEADGGTLFLDEIGELSPRGQAKLLRVIQDGETRRIGENLPRRVDTRIIAATNRSLRDEADAGQFRADLLYRLDVIRIVVPPLRARPEDVAVLARAFWEEATARLGSRATLDPATLTALARYHWPGNVRELHNAIMALAVHAPPRGRVTPSQLPVAIVTASTTSGGESAGGDEASSVEHRDADAGQMGGVLLPHEGRLDDARRAFESRYIRAALARVGGSPSRAAHDLGLTRQGLRKLMERLGLNDDVERRATPKRPPAPKERSPP